MEPFSSEMQALSSKAEGCWKGSGLVGKGTNVQLPLSVMQGLNSWKRISIMSNTAAVNVTAYAYIQVPDARTCGA